MGKARQRNNSNVKFLNEALTNNAAAVQEGPKKKKWSQHDIKTISPLTATQEEMFHLWYDGFNVTAHGSAGTGKTFLAIYLALQEVIIQQNQQKIILVRSAVPTREIGFLPGGLEEKTALYELPYHDILGELVGRKSTYQDMKDAGIIEFMTTSFIRGLTWDNAIVIIDEGENMTFHEIDSIMTRLGQNSRVIFAGDLKQTDLDGSKRLGESGMGKFLQVIRNMKGFADVAFTKHDIVRSEFVKSWIMAKECVE